MDEFVDSNMLATPEGTPSPQPFGVPAIILPKPFSLSRHSNEARMKIVEEVMDKVSSFENNMSSFYGQWSEIADSYRMITNNKQRKDKGLFESKVGETHRSINTLATMWFRMLTAADPYVETYAMGYNEFGQLYSEEELYGIRELTMEQHRILKFKPNLLRSLISVAGFGTVFVEKPWVKVEGGQFEGTMFRPRSLLSMGFDPNISDISFSDYVYSVDYLSKWKLLQEANIQGSIWDKEMVRKIFERMKEPFPGNENKASEAYTNIMNRKQRAGYGVTDDSVLELINYHGKLDTDNSIFEDYWEREQRPDDMADTDWSVGVIGGMDLARFHTTPMGTWKHVYEVAHYNNFEEEALGYGAGRLGRRIQSELDMVMSRANDAMMMAVYSMYKTGKLSGLNINQLNIKPFHVLQLDDVDQLKKLDTDINSIAQALAMMGSRVEDFRSTTGAPSGLQAIPTEATATEASLTQAEGMRSASVAAEIIGESIRGYFRTQHINNCYLLDSKMAVSLAGPGGVRLKEYSKDNIPFNIGFKFKITTDKDFRPERLKRLLEMINLATSIRQIVPESLNVVEPLFKEAFRLMGLDPSLLSMPKKPQDLLSERLQKMGKANAGGAIQNEMEGEIQGAMSGSPAFSNTSTPMGMIPTSPQGAFYGA